MLQENFKKIEENIQTACRRVGRDQKEVKLLLATKTREPATLKECMELGFSYFAENRVQEFLSKKDSLPGACWDFIGHLQSKKCKEIVGAVDLIHSVDRVKLVDEIQKRAQAINKKQKILIEVNTSGEESKSGVHPDNFEDLLKYILEKDYIQFKGLMTLATNSDDEEIVRKCFQQLAKLRENASIITGIKLEDLELSMGMSSDYQLAIEEGATIIRIGSSIFGPR